MSDLGAYKKLSEETRRFDKPLSQRVIWQLADALDSVVARLERLEAQRDEALRIALLPLDGYDLSENFDGESFAMRALRRIVRIFGDETETQS